MNVCVRVNLLTRANDVMPVVISVKNLEINNGEWGGTEE